MIPMMAKKHLAAVVLAILLALAAGATGMRASEIDDGMPLIHMLRPLLHSGGDLGRRGRVPCDSWRFAVETNTLRDWDTVPARCEKYVGNYMLGGHYRSDSRAVANEAIAYAEGLNLTGQGKEVWVFDVDETTLSNLPYYAKHGFGERRRVEPYNWSTFGAYVKEANAPVLPETQRLYKRLQALGIKPVILTGRREDKREATANNLAAAGYTGYLKLLLKPQNVKVSSIEFKSGERKKLQDAGYVIVGNIGDQWTDLLGEPEGGRTFKLPDPMYYIG
ncbi:Vegetative storage protein 2 [Zea mays]|uniref:Vegetative storage protein 2 n=1 Tax=Zea mays TaxID=4577 RepID=A0A1D6LZP8_MAIZE|nr:Vegetative storage protein 2 [Zea mays]